MITLANCNWYGRTSVFFIIPNACINSVYVLWFVNTRWNFSIRNKRRFNKAELPAEDNSHAGIVTPKSYNTGKTPLNISGRMTTIWNDDDVRCINVIYQKKRKQHKFTASIEANGLAKYLNWNRPALHHLKINSTANIYTQTVSTASIPRWTVDGKSSNVLIAWRKHDRNTKPITCTSTTVFFLYSNNPDVLVSYIKTH